MKKECIDHGLLDYFDCAIIDFLGEPLGFRLHSRSTVPLPYLTPLLDLICNRESALDTHHRLLFSQMSTLLLQLKTSSLPIYPAVSSTALHNEILIPFHPTAIIPSSLHRHVKLILRLVAAYCESLTRQLTRDLRYIISTERSSLAPKISQLTPSDGNIYPAAKGSTQVAGSLMISTTTRALA